jgi:hypothetical protein
MKTLLKSFTLTALAATAAFSADRDTTSAKYDIGVAAGMVGGVGLSVRRWFGEKDALQLNFAPFYIESKYPEDDDGTYFNERVSGYSNTGFISLGGLYLHRIAEFNGLTFSTFGGGSYTGLFDNWDYTTADGDRHVNKSTRGSISAGGGFGGGIEVWRFDAMVMVGIIGAYDLENETKRLTPSIDVGLHFRLY